MPFADVNGAKLWYVEEGSGERVVFVHGIPTDYRAWSSQMGPFSKQFRVIAYSRLHAHPNSNAANIIESTIQKNADDLEGLIRGVAAPPVHLVGHSYGGFIAAYLAARRPELIKKLVLIEPGITTMLVKDPTNPAQMLSFLIRSPSVALAAVSFTRKSLNPLLKAYHQGDLSTSLAFFVDGLTNSEGALERLPEGVRTMLTDNAKTIGEVETKLPIFTKEDARKISAMTLLVYGGDSPKILPTVVQLLARSVPHNEVAKIPNSTHFPHFENPEMFNERVLEFLTRK